MKTIFKQILLSLLLLTPIMANDSMDHVLLWYKVDGNWVDTPVRGNPGDQIDIHRDAGSQINVRVLLNSPSPQTDIGIFDFGNGGTQVGQTPNNLRWADFNNCVGGNESDLWATVYSSSGNQTVRFRIFNRPIIGDPNLSVSSLTVNSTATPLTNQEFNVGDTINVQCIVVNNGGPITRDFYVDFFLSTNQNPQGGFKRGVRIESMAANETRLVTFDSYTLGPGDVNARYVVVHADSTNRIQESNENNNTRAWGPFSITTPLTPPTNPSPSNGLTGVTRSGTFSWTGDSNAHSYDVYLGQTSNISQMSFLGNTANSNMTYNSLLPGVTYYWVVKAKNAHEEEFGNVWSFTTIDDRQPLAFSSVGAPQTPDGLLWASSSDVFTHGVTNGRAAATSSQPLSQTISGSTGEGLRVEATAVVAGAGWGTAADYSTNSIRMPFVATGSGLYNVNGQLLSEQVARSLGYAFTGMSRPSYELKNRIRILDENQEYVSGRLLLNHQNIANFAEAVEEFQLALYTTALNQVLTFGMGHAVQMVGDLIAETALFTKGFVDNTYADPDLERQSTHHIDFNVYLESGKTYYLELSTESFVYAQTFSLNSLQYTNLLSSLKVGNIAVSPVISGSVISPSTPTNINISNSSVIVNMPVGSRIGDLSVTDERGNDHVLSLVSGTGSTNNDEFVISGNALFTSKELVSEGLRTVRVRAMNEFGNSFEKAFQFTVVANPVLPPNVTSHPLSSSVSVGDFVTFTTSANGGGDLGYLWEYSEDNGASWTATSWSNSNSISVGPTALSWSGRWYRCVIVNESGSAVTDHSELTVVPQEVEPAISTSAESNVTHNSASTGGNVGNDGGCPVTARGVVFSTNSNPTLGNGTDVPGGSGTGSFTSNLTGLNPSTTYYIRAYATNCVGTAYGSQITFTTLPQPVVLATVSASSASNVTHNSATTGGDVTNAGGGTVTARGVVYSTSQNPTLSNGTNVTGGSGTGSFTTNLTNLNPSTTYYVRAYATNSFGTAYGSQVSFTTLHLDLPPTLTTTSASNVTHNSATSGGNVTHAGGGTMAARGVVYSTSQNPTLTSGTNVTGGSGTGSFSSNLSGLSPSTTYYVRAYATNSAGTSYGNQISFTTLPEPDVLATVSTTSASNVTHNSATSGGNVTHAGGGTVTARGVVYSTSQNPTLTSGTNVTGGSGTGSFSSNLSGLSPSTTYYVRAYATNSAGTAYGSQIKFTTDNETSNPSFYDWINRPEVPLDRRGHYDSAANDGVVNIVKYFQGIDPMDTRGLAGLQQMERPSPTQMRAWFLRSKVADDTVTGTVRWSRDLVNWHESGATDGGSTVTLNDNQVQADNTDPKREWVEIVAGIGGNIPGSLYLRLEVDHDGIDIGNPNMVTVQGGTLGTSNALNGRVVSTFQIGKYEVTWGEWKTVRDQAAALGYDIGNIGAGCADNHPVHTVNWYDVVKWCNLKSEIEGLTPVYTISGATYKSGRSIPAQNLSANGYRLPMEAEWEFAARGGNQTNDFTYSGSVTIGDVAWFWDNASGAACPLSSGRGSWPVGVKAPNELGLHDMSGNVLEWCWDANGSVRRTRGGSWHNGASNCSVTDRGGSSTGYRNYSHGFRLARSSRN